MQSSGASPYRLHSPAAGPPGWVPAGWTWLGHCQLGEGHVLLHPEYGIALLEEAPAWTEAGEAQLRARLEARRFEAIFPGYMPVVQVQAPAGRLAETAAGLPGRFASQPPLRLAGGDAWVGMAARALQRSASPPEAPEPAPEATPLRQEVQPPPAGAPAQNTPFPPLPRPSDTRRPPWLGITGILLALAGLATGGVLLSSPGRKAPPAAPPLAASPSAMPPLAASPSAMPPLAVPPLAVPPLGVAPLGVPGPAGRGEASPGGSAVGPPFILPASPGWSTAPRASGEAGAPPSGAAPQRPPAAPVSPGAGAVPANPPINEVRPAPRGGDASSPAASIPPTQPVALPLPPPSPPPPPPVTRSEMPPQAGPSRPQRRRPATRPQRSRPAPPPAGTTRGTAGRG